MFLLDSNFHYFAVIWFHVLCFYVSITTCMCRNCWQNYVDYYRCQKIKGENYSLCDYFKKTFEVLCPSEWVSSLCTRSVLHFSLRCCCVPPEKFSCYL